MVPWVCSPLALRGVQEAPSLQVLQEQRPLVPVPRVQVGPEQAAVWRQPVCWELPESAWLLVLQELLPFSQTKSPYRLAAWLLVLQERRFA